ncbi:hypothetical protein CYMTET_44223 [Cymbomonas tetramitiformis]|uniref:Uncharacterized protein n=1 Tax=Cymbomonas tetramitiformis TaxID=36881 RepID=A0AAE0EZJ4_9CHLO|nr:hypothetical protein CYMTET_44224 [Cymbomonas tetramitiformis]KAK3246234.1 hypothetical protein CYMTET_44223 [Cymbomonas tetramitiformis]
MHTLALCHIFQVAADDGSEAFAAEVAEYGAPAVLAGGESDEIDVSAYGFAASDSGSGVLTELESLTSQVRAMEDKVVPHMGGASAGGVTAADFHYSVSTEEFPGLLGIGFAGAAGIGETSGGGMPAAGAQPTAVPPPDYWPEGHSRQ